MARAFAGVCSPCCRFSAIFNIRRVAYYRRKMTSSPYYFQCGFILLVILCPIAYPNLFGTKGFVVGIVTVTNCLSIVLATVFLDNY